jgi:hypothetical protein
LIFYAGVAIELGHDREARWALANLSEANDATAQVAAMATELLRRADLERESRHALDHAAGLSLSQLLASPPQEEQIPAESLWEGEHPLTSPVYLGSAGTNLN